MKFKVLEGTETFEKFRLFFEESKRVGKESFELSKSLGFESCLASRNISGGISAFISETKPEGYKQVYKKHGNNYWFPKSTKENKKLIEKINSLPVITEEEYNSIIGFETEFVDMYFCRRYGLHFSEKGNCYLINTGRVKDYKPNSDMIEILESEYNNLKSE
jgi:alpha-acetolactate decarboxylase